MRAVIDLEEFDFKATFAEAASDVLKDLAREAAKNLAAHYVSEVFVGMAGVAAQSFVGGFAGPLLKVLLHTADRTSEKLNLLVGEPFKTGVRKALDAIEMFPESAGDRRLQRSELEFANQKLEEAYTLASGKTARRILRSLGAGYACYPVWSSCAQSPLLSGMLTKR